MVTFSNIQDAAVSRLDCGHQRLHGAKWISDVVGSRGTRPGRTQQQKAADATTPARGVVTFIPAGRRGTRSRQCAEPSIVQAVSLAITVLK